MSAGGLSCPPAALQFQTPGCPLVASSMREGTYKPHRGNRFLGATISKGVDLALDIWKAEASWEWALVPGEKGSNRGGCKQKVLILQKQGPGDLQGAGFSRAPAETPWRA